ncbi:MAG: hypothetical protein K5877_10410 [Lachnospiraceae bacterium]|nr:hypothetical protein [Lachnospiraceae bacterium]
MSKRKRATLNRVLSIVLMFLLTFTQLPVMTFAAEAGVENAVEEVSDANTTVQDDVDTADETPVVSQEEETKPEETDVTVSDNEADETVSDNEAQETVSDNEAVISTVSDNSLSEGESSENNIEINQGMSVHTGLNDGNETYMNTFVAKKETVVMMKVPGSDSMTEEQAKAACANYKVQAKAVTNGQEADNNELNAEGGDSFSVKQSYDADCDVTKGWYAVVKFPTGPDKGTYNFHWYDGDNEIAKFEGVTFYETKVLNILVVPVKGYWSAKYDGGAPEAGAYSCKEAKFQDANGNEQSWDQLVSELKKYLLDVYPVADVNITEGNELEAGSAEYDMVSSDGQKKLWEEACKLQAKDKDGKDQYDLILAFVQYRQDQGGGQGYTFGKPTNIITYSDPDMLPTVAHEIAHCYQVGDEYDGGSFNNSVNFPPNGYKGRNFTSGEDISATEGANEYWQSPKEFKAAGKGGDKKDKIDENGAATMVKLSLHPYSLSQDKFITWAGVDAAGNATGDTVYPTISYMGSGYKGSDGYYWTSSVIWDHLLQQFIVKEKPAENSEPPAEQQEGGEQQEEQSNAEVFENAIKSGVKIDENSIFTSESDFYFSDDYRFGDSRMVEVYGWIVKDEKNNIRFEVNPLFSYDGDLEFTEVLEGVYKDHPENYTFVALDKEGNPIKSPVDGKWAATEFYGGFYSPSNNKVMNEVNFNFDSEYPEGTEDFAIIKGGIKSIPETGKLTNVVWQLSKDKNSYAEFDAVPDGYLTYADVNAQTATVEWEVYYPEDAEEPYDNKDGVLYTEVYYCPEGDGGKTYYIGCSLDEDWEEGYISFETDKFDVKWTRNAYVWIKVTNGVNAVDIYSDANEITLSNAQITLSGGGVTKKVVEGRTEYSAKYTGLEIKPSVAVKAYNPMTGKYVNLKKDTDFVVTYSDNIKRGTATVTVQGIGAYPGKSSAEFEITAKKFEGTAEIIPNIKYEKDLDKAVAPYLQVKDTKGNQLTFRKDYYVEYSDGTKTSQYLNKVVAKSPENNVKITATYKGLGNFEGTLKKKNVFEVLAADSETVGITNNNIRITFAKADKDTNKCTMQYTGKALKPAVKSVEIKSQNDKGEEVWTTLKKTDYSLMYTNNVNIGTARVTVAGKKSYVGSGYATFEITPKEVTSLTVSGLKNQPYTGNEVNINELPIVVKAGGLTLTKGVDYTVEKDANSDYKNLGKTKIIVKLIEAKGQKNTPKVKWSAKAKKTVVEKTFSIVKTGLNSSAVVIQTKNNDKSKNIIKDAEGQVIATMRAATKDEIKSGKRKFTFVIEGSADTLVKNADVSAALVVKAFGKDVDPKDYVVTVANTKNGKTGKITIKPVKGSKTYSGSKSITFMYVKDIIN